MLASACATQFARKEESRVAATDKTQVPTVNQAKLAVPVVLNNQVVRVDNQDKAVNQVHNPDKAVNLVKADNHNQDKLDNKLVKMLLMLVKTQVKMLLMLVRVLVKQVKALARVPLTLAEMLVRVLPPLVKALALLPRMLLWLELDAGNVNRHQAPPPHHHLRRAHTSKLTPRHLHPLLLLPHHHLLKPAKLLNHRTVSLKPL